MPFSSISPSNFLIPISEPLMEQPGTGKSPRRELQGPRPTPLKVRKDSHKIKKPPVAPQQQHHQLHQPQAPPRPPVIIYTVSPKVIHANPSEFMTLVQRLTGPDHATATTSAAAAATASTSNFPYQDMFNLGGAISPAARFASIEKTRTPQGKKTQQNNDISDVGIVEGVEIGPEVERSGIFPGILSPNPSSLPPIPPSFFSPPSQDPNPLGFLYDLSPVLHSNSRNYFEHPNNFFLPSPNFISPRIFLSPAGTPPSFDLFNNLFDV